MPSAAPTPDFRHKLEAYPRTARDPAVERPHRHGDPLLQEPPTLTPFKPLVVGHCGAVPEVDEALPDRWTHRAAGQALDDIGRLTSACNCAPASTTEPQ